MVIVSIIDDFSFAAAVAIDQSYQLAWANKGYCEDELY